MWDLSDYPRRGAVLADHLPWAALVAPGVVLNKDGSFQRSAAFRGPDLDSSTDAELAAVSGRLNGALRRLGSGWALFVDAGRAAAVNYPTSAFPDPVSRLVDEERRASFELDGDCFESRYVLTLVWLPPAEHGRRLRGWFIEGGAASSTDWREHLRFFMERTDRLLDLVEGVMPVLARLDDQETLTYLHACISEAAHTVAVPETPMHLDVLLADTPLCGGLQPRLGSSHLQALTVIGFPGATWPGLLDDLNRLPFAYRWVSRAIYLDKLEAAGQLEKIRRQWFSKRKSVLALLKEALTQEPAVLVDSDARNKAEDADLALQDLGGDEVGFAYVTTTVIVADPDAGLAEARIRQVEKVIQGRGFLCKVETLNAVEAWLGTVPGHAYANVRQPPLSTLNLAHMLPLSAVWAGPDGDAHLQAPPLLMARTAGSTPFRYSLHVGDVGHTLIAGPTGAGKSVLLALIALQFRRYEGAQAFGFDFEGSLRAATLGVGGLWRDLGGKDAAGAVALQPLRRIDDPIERSWAGEWLAGVLAGQGVTPSPEDRAHLWSALISLASAPPEERTLSGLCALLQDAGLRQALAPFTVDGPWGRLLDADRETLGGASMETFEIAGLIGSSAAHPVLSYLFHRIEGRLDGRPTLVIIDEGWLALDDALFGEQLKAWLKTLRKKNASVVFATQSLADIGQAPIAAAVIEACPTRIFLPNARALEPQIAALYEGFGLNARQIDLIGRAEPKRDYYLQSRDGDRLVDLRLGPVALAFCAAAGRADQALITKLYAQAGPEGFAEAWLRARRLPWAAGMLGALKPRKAS